MGLIVFVNEIEGVYVCVSVCETVGEANSSLKC